MSSNESGKRARKPVSDKKKPAPKSGGKASAAIPARKKKVAAATSSRSEKRARAAPSASRSESKRSASVKPRSSTNAGANNAAVKVRTPKAAAVGAVAAAEKPVVEKKKVYEFVVPAAKIDPRSTDLQNPKLLTGFRHQPFKRWMKYTAEQVQKAIKGNKQQQLQPRLTSGATAVVKYALEEYAARLLRMSGSLTGQTGRKTIEGKDVNLVLAIGNDKHGDSQRLESLMEGHALMRQEKDKQQKEKAKAKAIKDAADEAARIAAGGAPKPPKVVKPKVKPVAPKRTSGRKLGGAAAAKKAAANAGASGAASVAVGGASGSGSSSLEATPLVAAQA